MISDRKVRFFHPYSLGGFLILLVFPVVLLFSCTTEQIMKESPSWINEETKEEENSLLFTARGTGESENEADSKLYQSMVDTILNHMGFTTDDFSAYPEEREYLNRLMEAVLEQKELLRGFTPDELLKYREDNLYGSAARLKYDLSRYEQDKHLLRGYLSGDDGGFNKLLSRGEVLYDQGFPFSSFLRCMEGAELAYNRNGLLSGFMMEKALERGTAYLKETRTPQLVGPDKIYLGSRRSWPFLTNIALSSSENEKIQWTVDFSQPQKEGDNRITSIVLFSDTEGTARFSFPFPSGEGQGQIVFVLNLPVFSTLQSLPSSLLEVTLKNLDQELERFTLSVSFPVKKDRTVLRMGLVIDEKDVADKRLNSRTTEESTLASLTAEGYRAEILNFDLNRIKEKSDLEILREFNSQYGNNYDIILYSEAKIQGFSQKGDLYQMTAGSTLFEVDLWDHEVREIGQVSSSVTGGDPARLVSSAFFQLGNDIARTCFELNKN